MGAVTLISEGSNVMWIPVSALTTSPFASLRRGVCLRFQVENKRTGFRTVHSPNWHPSNGQAFSSTFGSLGLGACFGTSAGLSCAATNTVVIRRLKICRIILHRHPFRGGSLLQLGVFGFGLLQN